MGFVLMVCRAVTEAWMEISANKSACLAPDLVLGMQLAAGLNEFGVKLVLKTKALGSGL